MIVLLSTTVVVEILLTTDVVSQTFPYSNRLRTHSLRFKLVRHP